MAPEREAILPDIAPNTIKDDFPEQLRYNR